MAEITLGGVAFLPPEKVVFSQAAAHQRVALMDVGDITQLCPPGQRTIAFSGFFPPAGEYPFAGVSVEPGEAAEQLKKMMQEGKPVVFSISDVRAPLQMEVTIEKLQLWEEAGEDGCVYYELELQEYRSAQASVVSSSGGSVRSEESQAPGTYIVQEGDTLWAIAKKYLGDGSRYGEIAAASGIGNPNLIYPGQELVIGG
jgi:nucleoid-associated protein YgaU